MDRTNGSDTQLPAGVHVQSLSPAGVRLILPRHRPGGLRLLAVILAGLPLILMLSGFAVMCFLTAFGVVEVSEEVASRWWFLPFGLMFGAAAIGLSVSELFVFFGHAEIELARGRLKAVRCLGPLRRTRQCRLWSVERLNVPASHSAFGREQHGETLVAELNEREKADTVELARHYPNDRLLQVAQWLSDQISREGPAAGNARVEAVSETLADRLQQPLARQPADSDIRVEPLGGRLAVRVPPAGLMTYAGGMGALCGVMCLGMLVVAAVVAFNLDVEGMACFLVVPLLVSLLTFGAFVSALNGGRRQMVLTVTPDRLKLEQTAPFGSSEHQWSQEDIESIGLGPSEFGRRVHRKREGSWTSHFHSPGSPGHGRAEQQVPELQVRLHEGETWGLFAGRDEDELRWLATLLREQLQLVGPDLPTRHG